MMALYKGEWVFASNKGGVDPAKQKGSARE
jgi:hypothetical protein